MPQQNKTHATLATQSFPWQTPKIAFTKMDQNWNRRRFILMPKMAFMMATVANCTDETLMIHTPTNTLKNMETVKMKLHTPTAPPM